MLYTSKGDSGLSGLYGTKERFPKESPIYEALGTLDELNSLLGVCRARSLKKNKKTGPDISEEILKVQQCLFIVQAELAGAPKAIAETQVKELEKEIDAIEGMIENPHAFVVPGTTELSGLFDYARAVARRAEREVIKARVARSAGEVSAGTKAYLNRLSSFLYAVARYSACGAGAKEVRPSY